MAWTCFEDRKMSRFAYLFMPVRLILYVRLVAALMEYYRNISANERKLEEADFVGFTVIPTIASFFIAGYWIVEMMKYKSPDWSAYQARLK